ncbi:MAG: basic amino acid ABC transporter substrate-binding protein [Clostridiales bacterium]|nr:basic amino acid ABC transporter substrate-binding protein [Clostridiales bacterium]
MKNQWKWMSVVSLGILMVLSVTACGGSKKQEDEAVVYTAVTEATFPPFDTVDEAGNIVGFDMDLMNSIGEDQGFTVEYVDMAFDSLIPAVQAGNADMIAAGMWADDPERQKLVDFVIYYESGSVLLTRTDDDRITDLDSLTVDMKVASQLGSNYADELTVLQEEGKIAEAVILDGFDMCVLQLTNGDVDAIYVGYEIAKAYMNSSNGKLKIASDILNSEQLGFAVKKGNEELLEKIATGLENVKASGKYDELIEKWIVNAEE